MTLFASISAELLVFRVFSLAAQSSSARRLVDELSRLHDPAPDPSSHGVASCRHFGRPQLSFRTLLVSVRDSPTLVIYYPIPTEMGNAYGSPRQRHGSVQPPSPSYPTQGSAKSNCHQAQRYPKYLSFS
ncbi:hypothetical protein ACRALDRAFT_2036876 [Sodiomyces alcalophilus JCM 7366]|uniref:uncharacterized protein n=1 Tax=Sodiomyces alcalophilus JCM 7366 TaxID=591952 RepID=UPI0039B41EFE